MLLSGARALQNGLLRERNFKVFEYWEMVQEIGSLFLDNISIGKKRYNAKYFKYLSVIVAIINFVLKGGIYLQPLHHRQTLYGTHICHLKKKKKKT